MDCVWRTKSEIEAATRTSVLPPKTSQERSKITRNHFCFHTSVVSDEFIRAAFGNTSHWFHLIRDCQQFSLQHLRPNSQGRAETQNFAEDMHAKVFLISTEPHICLPSRDQLSLQQNPWLYRPWPSPSTPERTRDRLPILNLEVQLGFSQCSRLWFPVAMMLSGEDGTVFRPLFST